MSLPRRIGTTLALAAAVAACGHYRPALFADRPPVEIVHDDRPIPLPSRQDFDERELLSDVYLRRPLFDVVRPLDFVTGGDVNALDEVPASSWYDPELTKRAPSGNANAAPPTFPLIALDESPATTGDALVVGDAKGVRYELLTDPPAQPGLLTGAEVVGALLLRSLGLRAPRAWIVGVPESTLSSNGKAAKERLDRWLARKAALVNGTRRVSATLWPPGIDVGIASDFSLRRDDPNDRIEHPNRRTLRATKIFAHWMGWTTFGVRSTRDVYVGAPGQGHLLHFVIGASRAFGTQDLQRYALRDEEAGGLWWHLVTFGLSPPVTSPPRRSAFPSLGYLSEVIVPGDFVVSPPYSPFVRLTPADEYWAGKRLVDAGEDAIRIGVEAAELPDDAAQYLETVLKKRRRALIVHAMEAVTPLDVAATTGRLVWLRDRAIAAGVAEAKGTTYEISFLDADGAEQAPPRRLEAVGELTVVRLPREILFGATVLHVRVVRHGIPAPHWCDVHVLADRSAARVIGVRH
ncbi:hypothetical protein BH11MYX4_BH11MYX4_03710 [soil metagenome]